MNAQNIRKKYLEFFQKKGHAVISRAPLVPRDDPTTLFTGSGMQPLLPYLLGQKHPDGDRLVDSQTCLRAQDIDDIGDNRHTTFFEMLGNWSLGDYFKEDQIRWFFEFLTDEIGLDPAKIYVSCFMGSSQYDIPRDDEAAQIWQRVFQEKGVDAPIVELGTSETGDQRGMQGGRIFFYDDKENWWSRGGGLITTPIGDPCGPDSEVFYDFGDRAHNPSYGQPHPASDSGRFMEIGNQVFMQYQRTEAGFEPLKEKNVDFGGGLERIAAAKINSPDVFKISLLHPVIQKLEEISQQSYDQHTEAMRVIADHLRAATFLAVDGVTPSNKTQGYVMRRLVRRAMVKALELNIEQNFFQEIVPVITDLYHDDYPEVAAKRDQVITALIKEEKAFRQTLKRGLKECDKLNTKNSISGADIFTLYDTFGFPTELAIEEIHKKNMTISEHWQDEFDEKMRQQRERSQTASKGTFKGGLADASDETVKLHTATHLMYRALKDTLGDHVVQRGSNITTERLRFDFTHDQKVPREILDTIEEIVNQKITEDLPVTCQEENTDAALKAGVSGAFGDKYGETVKVYRIGDFSQEICGGPHVAHTGQLAKDGKKFKITKEEASSAGVRRIKAILE